MSNPTIETGTAFNLTATGNVGVATVDCSLIGFYVNSTSTGVIVLRRGGSGGTVMDGSITPAIGFHRFPASCPSGLHFTLVSGSIDITFFVVVGTA